MKTKFLFYVALMVFLTLFAPDLWAQAGQQNGVEYAGGQVSKGMTIIGYLLLGLANLVGAIFVFQGLMKMKAKKDGRGGGNSEGGVFTLMAGIACLLLPWIIAASTGFLTGESADVNTITEQVYGGD